MHRTNPFIESPNIHFRRRPEAPGFWLLLAAATAGAVLGVIMTCVAFYAEVQIARDEQARAQQSLHQLQQALSLPDATPAESPADNEPTLAGSLL